LVKARVYDRSLRILSAQTVTSEDLHWLQKQAHSAVAPKRLTERCQIILRSVRGENQLQIAAALGITRQKVARWQTRFEVAGRVGLEHDAPGRGRKPAYGAEIEELIVQRTLHSRPPKATQWSQRTLAEALGMSDTTVGRVWRAHGLKPHLVRTFKVSNDPRFAEKLEDIVGLYLSAPEHAIVLCCDEKSQVQALDRTQPGLPLKKGRAGTMTHDYVRHGTTTLFAALNVADGRVIGQCQNRHRHQEWLAFLKLIEQQTPADRELHLILDNYATHKHPKVQKWLAAHPRFHLHFTPTSASWLNMVERFFRDLTVNRLRRGVFHSLPELVAALAKYVAEHNKAPKPFVWTARANDILAKVTRARRKVRTAKK
jgi:transposase/transcriptional regulator with XRE-family HTH domain